MTPGQARSMNAKQRRRRELLAWVCAQYAKLNERQLARAMTCEALPAAEIPYHHRKALTEFRRLSADARVAACRNFLRAETHA